MTTPPVTTAHRDALTSIAHLSPVVRFSRQSQAERRAWPAPGVFCAQFVSPWWHYFQLLFFKNQSTKDPQRWSRNSATCSILFFLILFCYRIIFRISALKATRCSAIDGTLSGNEWITQYPRWERMSSALILVQSVVGAARLAKQWSPAQRSWRTTRPARELLRCKRWPALDCARCARPSVPTVCGVCRFVRADCTLWSFCFVVCPQLWPLQCSESRQRASLVCRAETPDWQLIKVHAGRV